MKVHNLLRLSVACTATADEDRITEIEALEGDKTLTEASDLEHCLLGHGPDGLL